MAEIHTTQQLTELLRALVAKPQAKPTDYRYVMYVRKSTEGAERQAQSLPDQIAACREMAASQGFRIVDIIKESESAKEPDIRPKFRAMMDKLKKGEYDGILSWHPDRLSRNMKEAGEIIDLLDKSIIKDLKFVSFMFENNASGKMLLGLAFVLSKQYSDKLSDDVSRGVRSGIESGKSFKSKHGYYRDRNQFLRPDGDYFQLIKKAWGMRLRKEATLDEIATYLNKSGYKKSSGIGGEEHKPYKFNKKALSELFVLEETPD